MRPGVDAARIRELEMALQKAIELGDNMLKRNDFESAWDGRSGPEPGTEWKRLRTAVSEKEAWYWIACWALWIAIVIWHMPSRPDE